MSSSLIRQDLVPIVSGYVILMTALGVGLWLSRRPPRAGRSSRFGWPRLLRHLAGTAVGGYVLLMAIVILYYYLVARVAGSFLDSAVTGCATLIGLSLPVFAGASWLAERRSGHRARARADDQAPAGRRQRRD